MTKNNSLMIYNYTIIMYEKEKKYFQQKKRQ